MKKACASKTKLEESQSNNETNELFEIQIFEIRLLTLITSVNQK